VVDTSFFLPGLAVGGPRTGYRQDQELLAVGTGPHTESQIAFGDSESRVGWLTFKIFKGASMTERETILMIQVILSYVEDMGKGKTAPGQFGIRNRLRMYDKNLDKLLAEKNG
jgi:hypothetical protein